MSAKLSAVFDAAFMRKLELLRIHSRKSFAGRHRGERRSPRRGSSVEFADFRQYYPGDDFRYIDWHAYARLEQLYVKLFIEEEDLHLYLLVDTSKSMAFGEPSKLDYARRLAACLAYISLANLDRVSLSAYASGDRCGLPPARGKGRIFAMLEFLDGLEGEGGTSLDRTIAQFLASNRRPGVVIVLSDFFDPDGFAEPLARLVYHRFQPMVIHLLAPEDVEPGLKGDFRLVDSETGRAVDVSMNQRARKQYRIRLHELLSELERFCLKRQVPYLRCQTDTPFEDLLLRYLRQAQFIE